MVNTSEASVYLPSAALENGQLLTIAGENTHALVEVRDPKDPDKVSKKVVLGVEEYSKPIILNNTSKKSLERAWGTETGKYVGRKLQVSKVKQNVRGTMMEVLYYEPAE